MKKIILSVLLFLSALPVFGQGAQRIYTALMPIQGSTYAQLIPSASIYVCVYNANLACVTPLTIYSDVALTKPITQPLIADAKTAVYQYFVQSDTQLVEKVCAPYNQCTFNGIMVGNGAITSINGLYGPSVTVLGDSTISVTPGLNTLQLHVLGASTCGSVAGDNTTTNCGYNNLVPNTATIPANISTFGNNLLDNNLYGNLVAVGSNSGNTHGTLYPTSAYDTSVFIGNNNANGHDTGGSDTVDIGMTNGAFMDPFGVTYQFDAYDASTVTIGFGNLMGTDPQTNACNPESVIVMGHGNLNHCTGNSLLGSIVMGESNLYAPVAVTNTQQLNRSVVLGNYNVYQPTSTTAINDSFLVGTHVADYYQTLTNVFAFGYKAFQQQTASTWNLQNAIAIGEFAGQGIPNNSKELVLLGDGAGNIQPNQVTPLVDAVMIGDIAGEGHVGSEKVGIGHVAMGTIGFGFNSGNELIAIGHGSLLCGTTGTENIAIGHLAGSVGANPATFTCGNSNHTGSDNVWVGSSAGPNTATQLSDTIAIGFQSYNTASDQAVFGGTNTVQVLLHGITATPTQTAIASAATIAPTAPVFHVTGTAAIATITAPPACTNTGYSCHITIIPDGAFTTTTTGNIALASTAVVNKALIMTYDPAATTCNLGPCWYPSY